MDCEFAKNTPLEFSFMYKNKRHIFTKSEDDAVRKMFSDGSSKKLGTAESKVEFFELVHQWVRINLKIRF